MINRRRGEIEAVIDGKKRVLCLTLGALAELETAFASEDLAALVTRFQKGKLAARDALAIITAGLRGAGEDVDEKDVAVMKFDNGAAGMLAIVVDLLSVTFAGEKRER